MSTAGLSDLIVLALVLASFAGTIWISEAALPDCPRQKQLPCESSDRFRTIDGTCNNRQNTNWGASKTPMLRLLPAVYEDGRDAPVGYFDTVFYNGYKKPNARDVSSNAIAARFTMHNPYHSVMLAHWGQFVSHDITHATEAEVNCSATPGDRVACYNIDVPNNDARLRRGQVFPFKRSNACRTPTNEREQLNQVTSYIDGSQVYGSSVMLADALRDRAQNAGQLLVNSDFVSTTGKSYLPFDYNETALLCHRNRTLKPYTKCFLAGDLRTNEQLMLLALHTLFVREHNRVAKKLHQVNRHWDDDRLYQETRKIVGAVIQHVTFREWLPKIIGTHGLNDLGHYQGYNPNTDASSANEIGTAVLRFGHTIMTPILEKRDRAYRQMEALPLRDAFFTPETLLHEGGLDPLLRGAIVSPVKEISGQALVNMELIDHLFPNFKPFALDLAALNIQRGREHGLPSYNAYREFCGLPRIGSWVELADHLRDPALVQHLQSLYELPDNMDLWVGGISELPVTGSKLGPTFTCLLLNQLRRLRDGDRFWYENPDIFTNSQIESIKEYSLARVICNNGDAIDRVPQDVFRLNQVIQACGTLPDIDFLHWREKPVPSVVVNSLFKAADDPAPGDCAATQSCSCRYQAGTWGPCDANLRERMRVDVLKTGTNLAAGKSCARHRIVREPCELVSVGNRNVSRRLSPVLRRDPWDFFRRHGGS